MINENEIRVGNMFEYSDKHPEANCMLGIPIVWTDVEWYRLGDCREDLNYYNPIKLTEEWLLKFGFSESDLENGRILVVGESFEKVTGYVITSLTRGVVIKSVHQLQNLYFALNEKELTLI